MTSHYVCNFSDNPLTLCNIIKESFGSDFPDILDKSQVNYLHRYLKDIDAQSILLESNYIDKDYLDDFTQYYVKCFNNRGHRCARVHFFSTEIDHTHLAKALSQSDTTIIGKLKESYLGFITIKPLPKTFIGRTCLKTYFEKKHNTDKHVITREYLVDLFGIELKVNSIAFQEQDKVVSACATTAIWSALHALKWKNIRDIPACSTITSNALNYIEDSSNSFPSKELSNKQILRALDLEKLRYHNNTIADSSINSFFETIQEHIDSELPLILGVEVYSIIENTLTKNAGHAVTVLGYNKSKNKAIYIHDDRLGPFARAQLIAIDNFSPLKNVDKSVIASQWGLQLQEKDSNGNWKDCHEILIPDSLIIPTPRKARLTSHHIRGTCNFILDIFNEWDDIQIPSDDPPQLTYMIKLREIPSIRKEILDLPLDKNLYEQRERFLTGDYARYQWEARFQLDSKPAFRIFFDATEVAQGNPISFIFKENLDIANAIFSRFENISKISPSTEPDGISFANSFVRKLKKSEPNYSQHLDVTYGELRAPKKIKPDEVNNGDINQNKYKITFYSYTKQSLSELFPELTTKKESYAIWAIAKDGELIIGREDNNQGHPTLTGFKPARIAGELKYSGKNWTINSKSGRYSGDYSNTSELLINALDKFKSTFQSNKDQIEIEPR